ncbi:hypothetical protein AB205_0043270, partial [Aquarana catesbeiana]
KESLTETLYHVISRVQSRLITITAPLGSHPGPPGKPSTLDHQVCPLDPQGNANLCPGSGQSMPRQLPISAHSQCLPLPVPPGMPISAAYQRRVSVPISATHKNPSLQPFSAHQCCLSVPPMSAHQCRLSMPISAAYQCRLPVPISVAYQCPSSVPAHWCHLIGAALSVPISQRENLLIYKTF